MDALFRNERGEVTEGAIQNVLIRSGEQWRTPSLRCGGLPGVFRAHLLATRPELRAQAFGLEELLGAEEVWLCNAVRGMRRVSVIGC